MRLITGILVNIAAILGMAYDCPHSPPVGGSSVTDLIPLKIDPAVVEQWLPDDLTLTSEMHTMDAVPIFFTFSVQTRVCNNALDKTWLDGRFYDLTYKEFTVTVPEVKFRKTNKTRSNGTFTFVPRAYINDILAMVIGWDYGIDKARSHITHDANTWLLRDFDTREPTLSLSAENMTDWIPTRSLDPNSFVHLINTTLNRPLVGNAQGPPGTGGEFFMCADSKVFYEETQDLKGTLNVAKSFLPGLAPFNYTYDIGFRLRGTWWMSMTNNCSNAPISATSTAGLMKMSQMLLEVKHQVAKTTASIPSMLPASGPEKRVNECSHPPGAGGGGGTYLADFIVVELNKTIVEEMLPEGVKLSVAMQLLPVIPCIFVFGLQYNVCNNAEDKSWLDGRFFDLTYNEFIMAIPEVTFSHPKNGRAMGPFTYQPRLFLNDSVAMSLGWGFGIDKVLADFTHDLDTGRWEVRDWDTKELTMTLNSKNITDWMSTASLSPDSPTSLFLTGINTPILGLSGRGYKGAGAKGDGFFVCGVFDWQFFDHAEYQLIDGKLRVLQAFDNAHVMPLLHDPFLFGVRVRTNWSMSFPNDCSNARNSSDSTEAWVKLRDTLLTAQPSEMTEPSNELDKLLKPMAVTTSEILEDDIITANTKIPSSTKKTGKAVKPKKLAVLGTGLGAMTAVFYMTNYTGWQDDWDIDVYQLGWRMGGKGASGRTMNKESGYRILEHGLHFFFSFYRNTFQFVLDLYRAWTPPANYAFQKWEDAFKPGCNNDMWVHMEDDAKPTPWAIINQEDPAHGWMCQHRYPSTEMKGAPTPWNLFKKLVRMIEAKAPDSWSHLIHSVTNTIKAHNNTPPVGQQRERLLFNLRALHSRVRADTLLNDVNDWPPKGWCNAGNTTLPATKEACKEFFRRATLMEASIGVGVVADDLFIRGFDSVNNESLDAWLCRHGDLCKGTKSGLRRDDLIRGLFDGVFGYANGRMSTPNFAAGNFLQNALQAMCPPGPVDDELAVTMRMNAGMGEVIFTPAYEILKARGVRFHFFHKVEALKTDDGETISNIDIKVQATVKAGSAAYEPTFDTANLRVWPDLSTPSQCDGCDKFFDQLQEGDVIRKGNVNLESYFSDWPGVGTKRLTKGIDFDMVLNGISSGALPYVSSDLMAKNTEWRTFVETTQTVATISLQVWTYNTTEELGYVIPNVDPNNRPRTEVMAAGGPEPYDTIADMTHLIQYETSNASATDGIPHSVWYFVSPIDYNATAANLSDTSTPAVEFERAFKAGIEWLEKHTFQVMPKWADSLYESMVAPPGVVGRDRLRYQYWRSNIEPTELYVLSTTGSIKHRPYPYPYREAHKVHPFKNMAVAGDHTRNGLNLGCAEAATTSGMMAAFGLTDKHSPSKFCDYEHVFHPLYPDRYPLVEAVSD